MISPGLGLLRKFQQYRRLPQDPAPAPGHHLEEELDRLTCKIDTLLCKIEGQDQDTARVQEEEVVARGRGGQGRADSTNCDVSVRGLWHQQSLHANPPLWSPGGLQEMFRQDHPDGRGSEEVAPQVHHVPGQGAQDQAERSSRHWQG